MAVGDVYTDLVSTADDGYVDCQPASGVEVVVNNIYHAGDVEVYRYDGTNDCLVATEIGAGVISFCNFRCTNTDRIRIKNIAGSTKVIGYDGVYTKAA